MSGLLDTSVFVAGESGRPLGRLPDGARISVVTLGELELGVLAATGDVRRRRARTLAAARTWEPLPITEPVMGAWARLVADCRAAGRRNVVRLPDTLIAATALTHGLPVVTQDSGFEELARMHPALQVILV